MNCREDMQNIICISVRQTQEDEGIGNHGKIEKRQGNVKREDREMEIKPQVLLPALDISNTNRAILNMIKRFYTSPK